MASIVEIKELVDKPEEKVDHIAQVAAATEYLIGEPVEAYSGPVNAADPRWHDNFQCESLGISPPVDLYRISDCVILPNGAIVSRGSSLLKESLYPYVRREDILNAFVPFVRPSINVDSPTYNFLITDIRRIEESIFYARDHGEAGYFHWIHSVVPRLGIYTNSGFKNRKSLVAQEEKFQKQTLGLLGYQPSELLGNQGKTDFVSELIYCTPMVVPDLNRSGGFFERALLATDFLRRYAGNSSIERKKRVFISRKDALIRRLTDEDRLTAELRDEYGFEVHILSEMSVASQIKLFSESEVVIGMHGAGLSNISFMPEGSLVVELLAPDRLWPTYRGIAARSRLRYAPYVADRDGELRANDSDLRVNAAHFKQFIGRAIEKSLL